MITYDGWKGELKLRQNYTHKHLDKWYNWLQSLLKMRCLVVFDDSMQSHIHRKFTCVVRLQDTRWIFAGTGQTHTHSSFWRLLLSNLLSSDAGKISGSLDPWANNTSWAWNKSWEEVETQHTQVPLLFLPLIWDQSYLSLISFTDYFHGNWEQIEHRNNSQLDLSSPMICIH